MVAKSRFGDEKRYDLTLYLQLTGRTQEITWAPDTMPHVVIQRLDKVIDGLEDALIQRAAVAERRQRKAGELLAAPR